MITTAHSQGIMAGFLLVKDFNNVAKAQLLINSPSSAASKRYTLAGPTPRSTDGICPYSSYFESWTLTERLNIELLWSFKLLEKWAVNGPYTGEQELTA
ncbi:hypothetical protein V6N13_144015 [Hibiscus sabdariffa]|uniref:Uncharacterized protein n=1 Tax=Hibiscus sabdariffa TaxID=183260 RepID=A0ABR2FJ89_9ROSI